MNRIQRILVSSIILITLVIAISIVASTFLRPNRKTPITNILPAQSYVELPKDRTVAAWIWRYPTELNGDIAATVDFAASENINTLYVYIDEYVDIFEMPDGEPKTKKLAEYNDALRNIIGKAKEKNIKVHALSGNPNYGYDSHSYIPPILLEHVYEFNRDNPDTQFAGLQFDIEFYDDQRFFGGTEEYTQYFLDLVDSLAIKTQELDKEYSQSLRLGFVIPFWFDRPNDYFAKPILPSIINSLKRLPDPYLVVMAYRNEVDGDGGVMDIAKDELKAAEGTPVKVVIAQELVENKEKKITHFGKSRDAIKQDFVKIIDEAKAYSSFEGLSINELDAYKETR